MNFGQAIAVCMRKYATFSGRASRSEFWWFFLFLVLVSWGSILVGVISPELAGILYLIVNLGLALPALAAGCRRLHDIGRSGWWQLLHLTGIGTVLLIFWWAQGPRQKALRVRFSSIGSTTRLSAARRCALPSAKRPAGTIPVHREMRTRVVCAVRAVAGTMSGMAQAFEEGKNRCRRFLKLFLAGYVSCFFFFAGTDYFLAQEAVLAPSIEKFNQYFSLRLS